MNQRQPLTPGGPLHTSVLTEREKQQREKDMFFLFTVFAIGLSLVEVMIIAAFIGSDHSPMAWAVTLLFGGAVWCLTIIMGGNARQCWSNIHSFRSY